MNRVFVIVAMLLLSSCATNRLHFAPYTTAAEQEQLRNSLPKVRIVTVSRIDPCTTCTEMSSIVWHAAVYPYEGFFPIPISDWEGFIRGSLEAQPSSDAKAVQIQVESVFLKTWQHPAYSACRVELSVTFDGTTQKGVGVVKLERPGQQLAGGMSVRLDPSAAETVRLAFIAALTDAMAPAK